MRSLISYAFTKGRGVTMNSFVAVAVASVAVGISFEAQAQDAPESDASSGTSDVGIEENHRYRPKARREY